MFFGQDNNIIGRTANWLQIKVIRDEAEMKFIQIEKVSLRHMFVSDICESYIYDRSCDHCRR